MKIVAAKESIMYIHTMNTEKMFLRITAIVLAGLVLLHHPAASQGSAGGSATYEPRYLIDLPTAGMLPNNTLSLDMDFYGSGGLLFGANIGLFNRVLAGISYGGLGIIGTDSPIWNKSPGFTIRLRIIEESTALPAIALGFDSQGKEQYVESPGRYTIKSRGIYAVVSKNFEAAGFLSFHGGINYSMENSDDDTDPDIFVGVEKSIGSIVSAIGEYDLAFNDTNSEALGRGRGYLNLGIRASFGHGLTIGFNLKDIFRNQQTVSIGNRTITIEFIQPL